MCEKKKGIACGGHWIVDRVKCIDHYPKEYSIAMISEEKWNGGGCAFNVIKNLAKFDSSLPLKAVGLIGKDPDGDWILNDLKQHPNISTEFLLRTDRIRTSCTDVYSTREIGSRTFFYFPGPNAEFSADSVDLSGLDVSMFHLGYLGLLETMDAPDDEFGRNSARLLHHLKKGGIRTSVDLITTERPDFAELVIPGLPFTDYLIINDFEIEQLTGIPVRKAKRIDGNALIKNAKFVFQNGVHKLLVIHFPEGAFLQTREGQSLYQPALLLPENFIIGSTGAGDSFCAAVLYGLYHDWSLEETLRFAVCAGAQNLQDLTSTGAITIWRKTLELYHKYPKQKNIFKY